MVFLLWNQMSLCICKSGSLYAKCCLWYVILFNTWNLLCFFIDFLTNTDGNLKRKSFLRCTVANTIIYLSKYFKHSSLLYDSINSVIKTSFSFFHFFEYSLQLHQKIVGNTLVLSADNPSNIFRMTCVSMSIAMHFSEHKGNSKP